MQSQLNFLLFLLTCKEKQKSPNKRLLEEPLEHVSPSKLRKQIESDHTYKKETGLAAKVQTLTKKIRVVQQTLHRKEKCIRNMKELLQSLKDKQLVESEKHILLTRNFGNMAQKPYQNQMKNARDENKESHNVWYSQKIKQFAMTLHYYSPKSYEFVHNILALPHPASLHEWGVSVDCNPGFLTNVINMVGAAAKNQTWMIVVVLIVDAMTLHKFMEFAGAKPCWLGGTLVAS